MIEVCIRFKNPADWQAAHTRVTGSILTFGEATSVRGIFCGFYFNSERSPIEILRAFEGDGFEFADFENIEFRAI